MGHFSIEIKDFEKSVQNHNLQSCSFTFYFVSFSLLFTLLTLLFTGHDMYTQQKQSFYSILTLYVIDVHSCFVLLMFDSYAATIFDMLPIMALGIELRYQKDQES